MSGYDAEKMNRIEQLIELFDRITNGANLESLSSEKHELIKNCVPTDVVLLVDHLVAEQISMDDLKDGINKLLGLLHNTIANYPYDPPEKESYIGCLVENNRLLDEKLQEISPLLQSFEQSPEDSKIKKQLLQSFQDLERFNNYYQIKEKILFPEIEKFIKEHRCLSVMGVFHADVMEKMKQTIDELSEAKVNYEKFKKISAELFYLMYTLKFREERILYTFVQNSMSDDILNSLFDDSLQIGFPFFHPQLKDNNLISLN